MKIIKKMMELANQYGCEVTEVIINKHIKFYIDTPSGKHLLVCSRTASDHRAEANNRSLIRQWSKAKPT